MKKTNLKPISLIQNINHISASDQKKILPTFSAQNLKELEDKMKLWRLIVLSMAFIGYGGFLINTICIMIFHLNSIGRPPIYFYLSILFTIFIFSSTICVHAARKYLYLVKTKKQEINKDHTHNLSENTPLKYKSSLPHIREFFFNRHK